jgi:NADH-quinone oxidoreductase subunit L
MALTFWGQSRVDKKVHPHESPAIMLIPLVVLALLSIVGGWIGVPHVLGEIFGHVPNIWEGWFHHAIAKVPDIAPADHNLELILMGTSVAIAAVSASLAFSFYGKKNDAPAKIAKSIGPVYTAVNNKYYVDEFYFGTIINPLVNLCRQIWHYVDVNFIDQMTYFISDTVRGSGRLIRSLQSGNLQLYAMYIAIGVVAALTMVLLR